MILIHPLLRQELHHVSILKNENQLGRICQQLLFRQDKCHNLSFQDSVSLYMKQ
jgi:hypothetical protein